MIFLKNVYEERIKKNLQRLPAWERKTLGDYFDYFVEKFGDRDYIVTRNKAYSVTGRQQNM